MAKWGEITLLMGVVTPFTTGSGAHLVGNTQDGWFQRCWRLVTPIGDDCKGIPSRKKCHDEFRFRNRSWKVAKKMEEDEVFYSNGLKPPGI